MLSYDRPVEVYEDLGFRTGQPLPLGKGEQLRTVHTLVQHVLFVLK